MNVDQLRESGLIFFEAVSGSHAYGTSTPKSDVDIRGFFRHPIEAHTGLTEPAKQIGDEKHDTTYYSLKRGFELLMTANPNMIELLWMPEDCVKIQTPLMDELIANRDLFISKKCFHTHSGYAYAQIKKAKGQNKKVHNPQPKEQPKKEDFCWVIHTGRFRAVESSAYFEKYVDKNDPSTYAHLMPSRPVPLKESGIDLAEYHCASLEHSSNMYRLYYYGKRAKGVFRGNDMLVCESIPIKDDITRFSGLLIFNQDAYEKALKDHKSYWDWMKNRNENRWVDQEKGKLNYDQKNMMHCLRLLMSGENILTKGEPIVRFEGKELEYLMQIRSGKLEYEALMEDVEERMAKLDELYKTSDAIPNRVNMSKIEALYQKLRNM